MLFVQQLNHESDFPKLSKRENFDENRIILRISSLFTTFNVDRRSTATHVHFLIVFSSAFKMDCLLRSLVYCFRNVKPHRRCLGWKSMGALSHICFQTMEHTCGVTPKQDLKRCILKGSFWRHNVLVILFPSFRNSFELTSFVTVLWSFWVTSLQYRSWSSAGSSLTV